MEIEMGVGVGMVGGLVEAGYGFVDGVEAGLFDHLLEVFYGQGLAGSDGHFIGIYLPVKCYFFDSGLLHQVLGDMFNVFGVLGVDGENHTMGAWEDSFV